MGQYEQNPANDSNSQDRQELVLSETYLFLFIFEDLIF